MNANDTRARRETAIRLAHGLALAALCSPYVQGALVKIGDFPGALAEMAHFGLEPPELFAPAVIVFELLMSGLVVTGAYRWLGALALAAFTLVATFIALRFWALSPGMERTMMSYAFFEHVALAGAFVLIALDDLRRNSHFRSGTRIRAGDRSTPSPMYLPISSPPTKPEETST